jgi:hypothetical protein
LNTLRRLAEICDRLDRVEREVAVLSRIAQTQPARIDLRFETVVGLVRTTTADLRSAIRSTQDALDRRLAAIERAARSGRRA